MIIVIQGSGPLPRRGDHGRAPRCGPFLREDGEEYAPLEPIIERPSVSVRGGAKEALSVLLTVEIRVWG